MSKILAVIGLVALLESCKSQEEIFMRLKGDWKVDVAEGQMKESWRLNGSNVYDGNCIIMNNQDTVFFETMSIYKKGNSYVYATSFLLNGEMHKTDFYLKKCNDHLLVFENKTHDFPQVITYKFFPPDSMLAIIGGKEKDTMRYEYFPMKKIIQ